MYFLQQRHLHCFLFRKRSHNYVYLIIILTQEEEHNQRFRQLSVEFSIHFVHFIHPYMNLLPHLKKKPSFTDVIKTSYFKKICKLPGETLLFIEIGQFGILTIC